MGFFSSRIRAEFGPDHDFWYSNPARSSASGVVVTPDAALRLSAVYACVRVISEAVAASPLHVFKLFADGRRDKARNHPLYDVLHSAPNSWQTSFEWREMLMGHLLLRGNAYCRIVPGTRGAVEELIPLHPDRVSVKQEANYSLTYRFRPLTGPVEILLQDEIFHLRGLSGDGITGYSPIDIMRDVIGTAIATEDYGGRLYRNGAQPGGILSHPKVLSQKAKEALKAQFDANSQDNVYAGARNAGKTMVLEEGLTWTAIGMRARDAEFLASRNFSVTEIARGYRVPPHMIADLTRSTFSNIENQAIEFVVHSLRPWLVRWEQAIQRDLMMAPRTYFAEFNVDGLLRGDTLSRYQAHGLAVRDGWKTRNEVRQTENMNPIDGLDTPLAPLNMADGTQPPQPPPQEPKEQGPPRDQDREKALADRNYRFIRSAAGKLANKELTAVRKALAKHSGDALSEWLDAFYAGFAADITKMLLIPFEAAEKFALSAKRILMDANGTATGIIENWEETRVEELAELGIREEESSYVQ